MKKTCTVMAVLALILALCACGGGGGDKIILIGADSTGKNAAGQLLGERIAARTEELSGGRLVIDYHPNAELGGDADLLRQAQSGDIALVVCQTAPLVSFIPEMAVFDLPMLFAGCDGETISRALNGENDFHAALCKAYERAGFLPLGFLQNATYRMTTSNRELRSLADFKGLQIRTMENKNHMDFWSAIGAEPTPLAWTEVFQALQTGMIDAQENAADTCVGANLQDVQKYLVNTEHILYLNQVLINQSVFDALPEELGAALRQAVSEAVAELEPQLAEIDRANRELLVQRGMTLIDCADSLREEILALDAVQELYGRIDESTGALGALLAAELRKA